MVSSQASSLFTAMWKKICCSHFRKGVQEVFQVESQIEEEMKTIEELNEMMIGSCSLEISDHEKRILKAASAGDNQAVCNAKLKAGTVKHFQDGGFTILFGDNVDIIQWFKIKE